MDDKNISGEVINDLLSVNMPLIIPSSNYITTCLLKKIYTKVVYYNLSPRYNY